MSVNNPTFTPPSNVPDPNQPERNEKTNRDTTVYTNKRDTTVFTPERLGTDGKTADVSHQTFSKTSATRTESQMFVGESLSLEDALREAAEIGNLDPNEVEDLIKHFNESSSASREPASADKTLTKSDSLFSGVKKVFTAIGQFFGSGIDSVDLKKYKSEILKKLDQDIKSARDSGDPIEMLQNNQLNSLRNQIQNAKSKQEVDEMMKEGLGNLPAKIRSDQAIGQSTTTASFRITLFSFSEKLSSLGKFILNMGKMPVIGLISLPGHVRSGIDGIRNGVAQSRIASTQMKLTEQRNALGIERELLKQLINQKFGENSINAAMAKGILNTVPDTSANKIKSPTQLREDFIQELKKFDLEL